MDTTQAKYKFLPWLYSEESSSLDGNQDFHHFLNETTDIYNCQSDFSDNFLEIGILPEESSTDTLVETWNRNDLPTVEWPSYSCTSIKSKDLGIIANELFNDKSKPCSSLIPCCDNETSPNCTSWLQKNVNISDINKPEILPFDEEKYMQEKSVTTQNKIKVQVQENIVENERKSFLCKKTSGEEENIFAAQSNSTTNQENKFVDRPNKTLTEEQTLALNQRSESFNFAVWALNNLLPDRKEFSETDMGSIIHATADYIETLRTEINTYLRQLGMEEELFWNDLESIYQKQQQQQKEKQNETVKKSNKQEESTEIKRPPNAFIRFSAEFRKLVAKDFPNRSNRDISQMLGAIWRRMRQEEKAPFVKQFYAELQQTRREHPDWNYAGKNGSRIEANLGDVQPDRLRPRNPDRSVHYKELHRRHTTRYYKNKKPKICCDNWVQCDSCNKWRKMPVTYTLELPEKWTCSMNPDRRRNNCDIEEEC